MSKFAGTSDVIPKPSEEIVEETILSVNVGSFENNPIDSILVPTLECPVWLMDEDGFLVSLGKTETSRKIKYKTTKGDIKQLKINSSIKSLILNTTDKNLLIDMETVFTEPSSEALSSHDNDEYSEWSIEFLYMQVCYNEFSRVSKDNRLYNFSTRDYVTLTETIYPKDKNPIIYYREIETKEINIFKNKLMILEAGPKGFKKFVVPNQCKIRSVDQGKLLHWDEGYKAKFLKCDNKILAVDSKIKYVLIAGKLTEYSYNLGENITERDGLETDSHFDLTHQDPYTGLTSFTAIFAVIGDCDEVT